MSIRLTCAVNPLSSDNSPFSRKHFKDIARKICKVFKVKKNDFIVEAGSNDGTFLKEIKNFSNPRVLGVDPSKNISNLAKKKKIETMTSYFNYKTSKRIISKYGKADLLYGANIFNHVDDNIDFLKLSCPKSMRWYAPQEECQVKLFRVPSTEEWMPF